MNPSIVLNLEQPFLELQDKDKRLSDVKQLLSASTDVLGEALNDRELASLGLDYEQPDRILEEFAREHGVLFLKLILAFLDHHLKTGEFLHAFGSSHGGHWNQAGQRLAAEQTFQFLKEQHLVPLGSNQS